jgi:hypothetical protein
MSNPSSYSYNPKTNFNPSSLMNTKNDSQKIVQQSNLYDPKQIKVIDYSKDNFMQQKNTTNFTSYNTFVSNQKTQPPSSNSSNISTEKPKTSTFLKDYQSELKKPSTGYNPSSNSYSLMSKPKGGPVKLQNEEYDKKSDQLINNFANKKNNYVSGSNNIQSINAYSNNQLGTIKRSNSKPQKEERPSTAPAKENKNEEKNLTGNSSLKRLPSPAVKSNNLLSNTVKNFPTSSSTKYRSQSPANLPMKTNTINNNKIGLSNSLKGMPINNLMKKWK